MRRPSCRPKVRRGSWIQMSRCVFLSPIATTACPRSFLYITTRRWPKIPNFSFVRVSSVAMIRSPRRRRFSIILLERSLPHGSDDSDTDGVDRRGIYLQLSVAVTYVHAGSRLSMSPFVFSRGTARRESDKVIGNLFFSTFGRLLWNGEPYTLQVRSCPPTES